MIQTIKNAWKIPELRKKIMFTIFALLIFRLGTAVPVPFVNTDLLGSYLIQLSTRAMNHLIISYPRVAVNNGVYEMREPSRFLQDIDPSLYDSDIDLGY